MSAILNCDQGCWGGRKSRWRWAQLIGFGWMGAVGLSGVGGVLQAATGDPISLPAAYAAARAQHPGIQLQTAAAEAARHAHRVATSAWLPAVSSTGSMTRQYQDRTAQTAASTAQVYTGTVAVNQRIWDIPTQKAVVLARLQADAEVVQIDTASQALLVQVADTYFQVMEAQATLQLREQEVQEGQRQWEQAQARLKVGLGARTDVEEARAHWDAQQAQLIGDRYALENQLQRLALLMDVGSVQAEQFPVVRPEAIAGMADDPLQQPLSGWIATSLQHHPALAAARLAQTQARVRVAQKRGGHFPVVQWQGTDTHSRTQSSAFSGDQVSYSPYYYTHQYQGSWVVRWDLFQGGQTQAEWAAARAEARQRDQQWEQTRREWHEKLENAYAGLGSTQREIQALQQAIQSGQSAVEATQAGLVAGTRTRLDVLSQLSKLYAHKRALVQTTLAYFRYMLQLKQAAGVLAPADLEQIAQQLDWPQQD